METLTLSSLVASYSTNLDAELARTLSAKGRRHYVIGLTFDLIVVGSAAYWLINGLL